MALNQLHLRMIHDPGHGWLEVPKVMSKYICPELHNKTSYTTHTCDYYEEDCECYDFDKCTKKLGIELHIKHYEVADMDKWIDGDDYPGIPELVYEGKAEFINKLNGRESKGEASKS